METSIKSCRVSCKAPTHFPLQMIISSKQQHGNAVGGDGVWVDAGFPLKKKVCLCVG